MIRTPINKGKERLPIMAGVRKYLAGLGIFVLSTASMAYEVPWRNLEIVIRGDYLRACTVAYRDFFEQFKGIEEVREHKNASKFEKHLDQIKNYNIEFSVGQEKYYIWIHPRLSAQVPGIFGGDASYVIDAKTFQIIEKQYGK